MKKNKIIDLIESIEDCEILCCNKTRGHFMFRSKKFNAKFCIISCVHDKKKGELHLMYFYPNILWTGTSYRILKAPTGGK